MSNCPAQYIHRAASEEWWGLLGEFRDKVFRALDVASLSTGMAQQGGIAPG